MTDRLKRQDKTGRKTQSRGVRVVLGSVSLVIAAAIWLPLVHIFFAPDMERSAPGTGVPARPEDLVRRHLRIWTDEKLKAREVERMRVTNAEWDFMGRSYLVWSLANMALDKPQEKARYLRVMDEIIDETLRLEEDEGHGFFLMDYWQDMLWVMRPVRSQFVDSEIALMLGARRIVEEKSEYRPMLEERVRLMVERMERSPVLCAESYPDECWLFCNTIALAAIRVHDALDGADHSDFIERWLSVAKTQLIHKESGLLISAYTTDGDVIYGPEGSSIWMAVHCLSLVDEQFAAEQYAIARRELSRSVLGFGYSREWPPSAMGGIDVDSGIVIPVLGAAPASSGLAFIAARTFGDTEFSSQLATSLHLIGFPVRENGEVRFAAGNQVGDAVLLYSAVLGPLWQEVKRRAGE